MKFIISVVLLSVVLFKFANAARGFPPAAAPAPECPTINCFVGCQAGFTATFDENGCTTCDCQPIAYTCPELQCSTTCREGFKSMPVRKNVGPCPKCPFCKDLQCRPPVRCRACTNGTTSVPAKNGKGCPICPKCEYCRMMKCMACPAGFTAIPKTDRKGCTICAECVPPPATPVLPTSAVPVPPTVAPVPPTVAPIPPIAAPMDAVKPPADVANPPALPVAVPVPVLPVDAAVPAIPAAPAPTATESFSSL